MLSDQVDVDMRTGIILRKVNISTNGLNSTLIMREKKINLQRKQLKNWQGLTSSINLKFHTAWDPYHILSPNKSIKAMMEAHVC